MYEYAKRLRTKWAKRARNEVVAERALERKMIASVCGASVGGMSIRIVKNSKCEVRLCSAIFLFFSFYSFFPPPLPSPLPHSSAVRLTSKSTNQQIGKQPSK